MEKVIILNAPPGAGKDTIAYCLQLVRGFKKFSFKDPMFKIAIAMSGIPEHEFMSMYHDREQKEKPQVFLGGRSFRSFMIHISENIMKPLYGNDVFGKRLASSMKHYPCLKVLADGGFPEEVLALKEYGFLPIIMRLHRDGYSFDGDSRKYIYIPGLPSFDIQVIEGKIGSTTRNILKAYDFICSTIPNCE